MAESSRTRIELAGIRSDLAGIDLDLALLRVERALRRKYDPEQPREPAGQPGGGRWTSGDPSSAGPPVDPNDPETTGSIGSSGTAERRTQEEVVTADGSRVLTIRIRSNPHAEWDEQHTITSPEGARTVVETAGRTQTIRDGETGAVLARSTLTERGVVPEAFVQSALLRPGALAAALVARTVEALGTLFTALSARTDYGKVIWAGPSTAYTTLADFLAQPIWVGGVKQREFDAACPRNREVQEIADRAAAEIRASGNYLSPQDFGNKVHKLIAEIIKLMHDPDLIAEQSYTYSADEFVPYGTSKSIRVDVLEQSAPSTVCVYDHKTGNQGLRSRRVAEILAIVRRNFPAAQRIVIIEVRPRP